jgi:hypothetical protein
MYDYGKTGKNCQKGTLFFFTFVFREPLVRREGIRLRGESRG